MDLSFNAQTFREPPAPAEPPKEIAAPEKPDDVRETRSEPPATKVTLSPEAQDILAATRPTKTETVADRPDAAEAAAEPREDVSVEARAETSPAEAERAAPTEAPAESAPTAAADTSSTAWTPNQASAETLDTLAATRAADQTARDNAARPDQAGETREGARVDIQRDADTVDASRDVSTQARPNATDLQRAIIAYGG